MQITPTYFAEGIYYYVVLSVDWLFDALYNWDLLFLDTFHPQT